MFLIWNTNCVLEEKIVIDGSYLKLVALDINALETRIVEDKNMKDINDVCEYFSHNYNGSDKTNAVWLILPCNYTVN